MGVVLIVDSSNITRELLSVVLRQHGYRTLTAANAKEALACIVGHRPGLIIMDLALPGTDGLDLLQRIRTSSHTADIPVLVLTGVADRAQVLAAVELAIVGYILKSQFELTRFLRQVRQAITLGRLRPAGAAPRTPGAVAKPAPHGEQTDATAHDTATPQGPQPQIAPEAAAAGPPAFPDQTEQPVVEPARPIAEVLHDLKPVVTRSDIQERVDAFGDLRALSPSVAQVLKLTRASGTSVDSLVQAIRCDHAMALKLIKLANSTVYTRGEPVNSVKTAVLRIGMEQIRQTVLNISVIDQFNNVQFDGLLDYAQFWEHAIATGLIAAEIARVHDAKAADAAFTMGLLHDVGRMILAEQLSDEYVRVLRTARDHQLPLDQTEKRMLLLNHADIMDRVLHAWKFPKDLIDPITFHQLSAGNIRRMTPRQAHEATTLSLANRLAHAMLLGCSGSRTIAPTEELCEALKIGDPVINRIFETAPEETEEIKFSMLSNSDTNAWKPLHQQLQNQLAEPINPVFVSPNPGIDAYRLLTARLAQPAEAAPNLGVVHFRSPRDRASLTREFLNAEEAAGATGLPLLLISPKGDLKLDDSAMNGRKHASLAEPVVLDRLIFAVNGLLAGAGTMPAPAQAA